MSVGDGDGLGGGGFFGREGGLGTQGSYGVWPHCGCGSLLIMLLGIVLVCGGFLSFVEGLFR